MSEQKKTSVMGFGCVRSRRLEWTKFFRMTFSWGRSTVDEMYLFETATLLAALSLLTLINAEALSAETCVEGICEKAKIIGVYNCSAETVRALDAAITDEYKRQYAHIKERSGSSVLNNYVEEQKKWLFDVRNKCSQAEDGVACGCEVRSKRVAALTAWPIDEGIYSVKGGSGDVLAYGGGSNMCKGLAELYYWLGHVGVYIKTEEGRLVLARAEWEDLYPNAFAIIGFDAPKPLQSFPHQSSYNEKFPYSESYLDAVYSMPVDGNRRLVHVQDTVVTRNNRSTNIYVADPGSDVVSLEIRLGAEVCSACSRTIGSWELFGTPVANVTQRPFFFGESVLFIARARDTGDGVVYRTSLTDGVSAICRFGRIK
ncbi:MAG: hypothetical protein ACM31L_13265 [Actinomycetota bacterium]